jgi:hypothetical protein
MIEAGARNLWKRLDRLAIGPKSIDTSSHTRAGISGALGDVGIGDQHRSHDPNLAVAGSTGGAAGNHRSGSG